MRKIIFVLLCLCYLAATSNSKPRQGNSLVYQFNGQSYVDIVMPDYDSCLIDGKVQRYFMCSKTDSITKYWYKYIGKGTMHSYDGILSHDKSQYFFFDTTNYSFTSNYK